MDWTGVSSDVPVKDEHRRAELWMGGEGSREMDDADDLTGRWCLLDPIHTVLVSAIAHQHHPCNTFLLLCFVFRKGLILIFPYRTSLFHPPLRFSISLHNS